MDSFTGYEDTDNLYMPQTNVVRFFDASLISSLNASTFSGGSTSLNIALAVAFDSISNTSFLESKLVESGATGFVYSAGTGFN